MSNTEFDVLGIGNAIVDVLARTDDAFLAAQGLDKGTMRLIDAAEAERLYALMPPGIEVSGGSAGNTVAGVASLGARAAFIGKVADDQLGSVFAHDVRAIGVHYATAPLAGEDPTARCLILVTPDGERTMNTYLGAAQALTPGDIDEGVVRAASITYLEGYLWDPPQAKAAFRRASEIAHGAGRKVALTLSDRFCVDRYRSEFLGLMREGLVDIVFANEHELMALYQTDFAAALVSFEADCPLGIVTRSERGAVVLGAGRRDEVPAHAVSRVEDTTGAGDLFAAGFLTGLARGGAPADCARLGALAAAEVIGHVGARPQTSLKALAKAAGLA